MVSGKKVSVFGIGYVGLASAVLLAQHNEVTAFDISEERISMLKDKKSPFKDKDIELFLQDKQLMLNATCDKMTAFDHPDFIIICTPTDYDSEKQYFDTSNVETIITGAAKYAPNSVLVIKSTVPVGFTEQMKKKFPELVIIFSPEFLREGSALHDNLYPSRIIIGDGTCDGSTAGRSFAELLIQGAEQKDTPVLFMKTPEAEAVKLFSNTYLALRVAFFNELDTFAELRGLDTKALIEGVCMDSRIGSNYNNPSFGYGGYCLPKDTKQLKANYKNVPGNLIEAVVESNSSRKNHIADMIIKRNPRCAGIYRLVMKNGSDNWRYSSVFGVIKRLKNAFIKVIVYEPYAVCEEVAGCKVVHDFDAFTEQCDLIIANRMSADLDGLKDRVYTRDIYWLN